MIYRKIILTLALPLFVYTSSYAGNKLSTCHPTKEHLNNYEPAIFPTSNNLLRKPGEFPITCGEKMIIRGRVVDKNCVPVSDAKVYIWQVACDGKYPYKPLRNVYKKHEINLESGATFTGAGQTITDNKGEFYFVTTYPASFHDFKPHIDFRVTHSSFNDFDTRFYVSKKEEEVPPVDFTTPYYKTDGTLVNDIQIVLPHENPLKEY